MIDTNGSHYPPLAAFNENMLEHLRGARGRRIGTPGPRMRLELSTLKVSNGPNAGKIAWQVRVLCGGNTHEHVVYTKEEMHGVLDGIAVAASVIGAVMVDNSGNEQLAREWLAKRVQWRASK